MLVTIGQSADHGFDSPLGLLSDCHRRIERFLSVLATIARVRRGGPLPDADRQALEGALRYFDTAAPRHSADEEESLFPRLRAAPDGAARAAWNALARLEADHRVAEAHHDAVRAICVRWLSEGTLPAVEAETLARHLGGLERLYAEHIRIEDRELFPAAGRALSAADLEAVGREMAARRGVPYAPPPGIGAKEGAHR
jgi:hemerythrin-like domain-containing protein